MPRAKKAAMKKKRTRKMPVRRAGRKKTVVRRARAGRGRVGRVVTKKKTGRRGRPKGSGHKIAARRLLLEKQRTIKAKLRARVKAARAKLKEVQGELKVARMKERALLKLATAKVNAVSRFMERWERRHLSRLEKKIAARLRKKTRRRRRRARI